MFYVYCKRNDSVFEPAEGGYWVETSEVMKYDEFDGLSEAYCCLLDYIIELAEDGEYVTKGSWFTGFVNMPYYDDDDVEDIEHPDFHLRLPWFYVGYTGYIGDGFKVGISVEKPEDKPYEGYC